jgi:hypothetical protein
MLAPFFALAAQSPSRRASVRNMVLAHLAVLLGAVFFVCQMGRQATPVVLGHVLLIAGVVEGATMLGWRLTQLPKSQALEFLLVSPVRPGPLFLAEMTVGLSLFGFVILSGLPVLSMLAGYGLLDLFDLVVLTVVPFTWGALTGMLLVTWAYEPKGLRRVGEVLAGLLVLVYLVVGVLAGEKLGSWLTALPDAWRLGVLNVVQAGHDYNPFSVMQFWLQHDFEVAWARMLGVELAALAVLGVLVWRASSRLEGHFHERHYEPVRDVSGEKRPEVGDRPLSWWAVKRVMEYSGGVNLWLAGGFCLLYGAYLIGGDNWPAWMGRRIFELCDGAGGVAGITAALAVLAAVPAAFQYGLWDNNAQDRCRRLELLLLTELGPDDYWDAAAAAAWRRGRGYFVIAAGLLLAALIGGRLTLLQLAATASACVLLWALYFTLGFRAFTAGSQANTLGLVLTVGLPLGAFGLGLLGWTTVAGWLPPGMVFQAGTGPALAWVVGPVLAGAVTLVLARYSLATCDANLREWYSQHHGSKAIM